MIMLCIVCQWGFTAYYYEKIILGWYVLHATQYILQNTNLFFKYNTMLLFYQNSEVNKEWNHLMQFMKIGPGVKSTL